MTYFQLSGETESFLKLQLEQQVNGDTGKIEKEDSARSVSVFSDKIVADFDGNVKQFAVPSAGVPSEYSCVMCVCVCVLYNRLVFSVSIHV